MTENSGSFSQQLRGNLAALERRDWELWILALAMVGILAAGYFFVIFPVVFLGQKTININASVSPQLLIGQLVLVLLFLVYLVHKHMQLRSLRTESTIETVNFQIAHSQLLLDPLTKALTRSALEEILAKEIKRVGRSQGMIALLYVDVNDFKKVNNRYGHISGDLVLTEVGAILKNCVRGSDYIIRMGGDEFLSVLVDTDESGAEVVKRRINQGVSLWNQNSPLKDFNLMLSIGLEMFDGTRSFDEVLSDADSKMYAEKKSRAV